MHHPPSPAQAPGPTPAIRRRLLALVALGALAACGKKGQLELPPEPDRDPQEGGAG